MQRYGMQCRVAENGEQAWALIKSSPPDLLITDLEMPSLNGLELLNLCREADYHFFVILISGCAEAVDQRRVALKDCCAAVIVKPFTRQTMSECLQAADGHDHYRFCVHACAASATRMQSA